MKRLLQRYARPSTDPLRDKPDDPRIAGPFPASVRGKDQNGTAFQIETVLDDLSARDFSLRLPQRVSVGDKLFVTAQIHEARVALRGRISRNQSDDESYRLIVNIDGYRFVSA